MVSDLDQTVPLFVRESNRIESILATPGDPLYDDHLTVARCVYDGSRRGVLYEPRNLHASLMRSQPEHTPGWYRHVWVGVGGRTCPDPADVPRLMDGLIAQARAYRERYRRDAADRPSEETLWDLHHELEYIHPFSDGNGRTGRLWLNNLRLAFGYEWLTVPADERFAYYAAIRDFVFRRNSR